jgi:ABC-type antimicrobial peptide transport system permease subunit
VRYRHGVDAGTELAHLRQTAAPLAGLAGLDVLSVQRPAAIVSSGDVGVAPTLLTAALVLAALTSLLVALGTSVRGHRKELSVLTALGFTSQQRAATVMLQSSAVIIVGIIIGLPGGTFVGRALWSAFARHIDVVSQPVAPWVVGGLVVVVALVLANIVALGPARVARRTNVAESLRNQ